MIKLGNNGLINAMLGNTKVRKIYCGSMLMYTGASTFVIGVFNRTSSRIVVNFDILFADDSTVHRTFTLGSGEVQSHQAEVYTEEVIWIDYSIISLGDPINNNSKLTGNFKGITVISTNYTSSPVRHRHNGKLDSLVIQIDS